MAEKTAAEINELVLDIRSAGDPHSPWSPFTVGEQIMMVNKAVSDFDITTYAVPIEDLDRNSVWISHVQSMSPALEVAYSNNPLAIQLFTEAGVEVHQSPISNREVPEGTETRQCMIEDRDWESLAPDEVADVVRGTGGIKCLQRVTAADGAECIDDNEDLNPC